MTMPSDNPMENEITTFEGATERIHEVNERLLTISKTAGVATLDACENALKGSLEFEEKVAGAGKLGWVSAITKAHTTFVRDMSGAYMKAAREILA